MIAPKLAERRPKGMCLQWTAVITGSLGLEFNDAALV